jgi:NAD(P)-dependent dehydrogenase (short-subunit alcohol dehydrogenase family)
MNPVASRVTVGIKPIATTISARRWDLAFTTNRLGPFAFTQALIPHLRDGANVVFTCSAVEDPELKSAVMAGFRGARYLSAKDSLHGASGRSPRADERWRCSSLPDPGDSHRPGWVGGPEGLPPARPVSAYRPGCPVAWCGAVTWRVTAVGGSAYGVSVPYSSRAR